MKRILFVFVAALTALVVHAREVYLFSYFVGERDGLHLAYSYDGLTWTALNNNQSFLTPVVGTDRLMRDPSIVQGPDGTFHMVWTSSWHDRIIGYASSKDLVNWSEQRAIPVMEHETEALNCWAPEIFYDAPSKTYYIFWATSIPGRHSFVPTSESEKQWNHRIYCTTTRDFQTFTPAKLWFNPDFMAIDAAVVRDPKTGELIMVVKNENSAPAEKNIRVTRSRSMKSFPTKVSAPITGDYWCEGPAPLFVGDKLYVYFDCYTSHRYGAVVSSDHGKTWTDVSEQVTFPKGVRHGTAFTVDEAVLDALLGNQQVTSPDGNLTVRFNVESGVPTYSVECEGKQFLTRSPLGLETSIGDFTQGMKLVETQTTTVKDSYDLSRSKVSHVDYVATQTDFVLENAKGKRMTVTFRVSGNDVAFRYSFPKQPRETPMNIVVRREATGFAFPGETTTYLSPQAGPREGFAATKPSYEEDYQVEQPLLAKTQRGLGYTFPCLFRVGDKGWAQVSETGVAGNYCGSHLSDYAPETGYTIAFPHEGENNGLGAVTPVFSLPGSTPWRTITVGSTLKPLVETTVQFDVVEPLYEASQDYRPGRYTWSWLIWQDASCNWDDQVTFIDLASAMSYEYVLVDAWWDRNIGRERMAELSQYAQSKGVNLFLWYNSNGSVNDAPQGPLNCMDTPMHRDREMAWMKSAGIKGIKVDFFGGDKQATMQLYEDILYDANRYGIQVIFHGCTLPRGWERMFPNFVGSEATLASENMTFSQYHCDRAGFELTMHPFCRTAVGSVDWGGVIMNRHLARDNKRGNTRRTSDLFEIATGITNQCSVQCIAIQPNGLQDLPAFELDFLRTLPTTWDETRLLAGHPGQYVALARRHGDQWYVACLNGTDKEMTLTLDASMFGGKELRLYNDTKQRSENLPVSALTTAKADKKGQLKVTLQPMGGAIICEK
ncbi:MAG: glycoside hydrolase family 97 catalytic domain-containing protein [Bacteroidaceae bacterium]|nr:glycoside hydrolase family 97 catalytic domain-containing protein [Bacteroidaceae bacterium]